MKSQILLILAVTIFAIFLGASTAISDENNSDQLTKFYEMELELAKKTGEST